MLLIGCFNVAGLLLARGVSRQRALAVCAALGASRGRLLRQLLTESVILGLGGGTLGLGVAAAVLGAVPALIPGDVARLDGVSVGGEVLAFTLGLSTLVGLAFGAVPAFQWSRVQLARVLNEGSARAAGGFRVLRANRTRAVLAVAQVALALMLLVGAGLLLRSFVALVTVDRGYDPANVITARTLNPDARLRPGMMSRAREAVETANRRFHAALLDGMARLAALPATTAVGLSSNVPLAPGGMMQVPLRVAGRPAPADPRQAPRTTVQVASPGWFEVLRLRLRTGRFPTRLDGAGGPGVVVVNETLAREVFGGEPAVGQRLLLSRPWGGGEESWEIIGVIADLVYGNAPAGESAPELFVPWNQADRAPVSLLRHVVRQRADGWRSVGRRSLSAGVRDRGVPGRDGRRRDDDGRPAGGGLRAAALLCCPRRRIRGARAAAGRLRRSTACSATRWRNGGARSVSAWRWGPRAPASSRWW